jgi:hypothetical protein
MGIKRGSISTPIIADGLVFNMDAANKASYPRTGTTPTDTIGSKSGTLTSGATFENINEGVFDLDGIDDYITFGAHSDLNFASSAQFTREVWFRRTASTVDEGHFFLIYQQRRTNIGLGRAAGGVGSDNEIYSYIQGSFLGTGVITTLNQWYCTAITYNNTLLKIYVDGVEKASATRTAETMTGYEVQFGGPFSNYLNGNIGPAHIYNRALSANEVLHNYNALKSRFE